MKVQKTNKLAIFWLVFCVSNLAHAKTHFSSLNKIHNDHFKVASVMTDKGEIISMISDKSRCAQRLQLFLLADYEIKDPKTYAHFQDNLQPLITETVSVLNKICGGVLSTLSLSRVSSIDKSGRFESLQRMGNVTAREQWITKHTQKQQNQVVRSARQKRNAQITEVRRYNHQQDVVKAVYTPAFEVTGPFNDVAGGQYLNAIYQGDFATIRKADKDYANSLKKLYELATGNNPGLLGSLISQAFDALNIRDSITAKYLFQYEQRFGECLTEDAETFGVEEKVPGIVATNMLGIEMWRTHGFSKIYTYRVNQNLAGVFHRVGTINPEAMAIMSFFLSSGLPDYRLQTLKGIEQIQNQFDCNDPTIKQFETNLRQLYN